MRRLAGLTALLLALLLGLGGAAVSADTGGSTDSFYGPPLINVLGDNTCYDVARYNGYIYGSYLGAQVQRATIVIQRARDGWYWDGWRFVTYPVELPLTISREWEFPFRPDYGLYFVRVEVVDIYGMRAYDAAPLALLVRSDEIVYQSTRNGNTDLYRANVRGGIAVGEFRLTDNAAYDGAPAFSPDHRYVAFESNRDGNFEIYVTDTAYGHEIYRLTNNPADDRAPSWAPDGKSIAFHTNRDGNYEIYTISFPYPNDLRRMTNNAADDKFPAWSPDIRFIAFQSNREGGKNQIFQTYFPYGQGTYRLGRFSRANDTTPSYSPDGRFIAFGSDRSGNSDIYLTDQEYGNSLYQVTRSTSADTNPVWIGSCGGLFYQSEVGANQSAIFKAENVFYGTANRRITLDTFSNLLRGLGG